MEAGADRCARPLPNKRWQLEWLWLPCWLWAEQLERGGGEAEGGLVARYTSGARRRGEEAEELAVRPERESYSSRRSSSGAAAPRLLGLQREL